MYLRKLKAILPAAIVAGALLAPSAGADSVKTCTEQGKNKNFTNTVQQTSACPSASDNNQTTVAVTNKGGNQPGGQQP
jgi:ABC-type oligopeptide transport system substrate-binding subunit